MPHYDECPACQHEIFNMQAEFVHNNYQTYFDMICPNCETRLLVDVTSMPVFYFRIAEEEEVK